jgi:hypothetical protein
MPCKAIEAVLALSARRHAHSTPPPRRLPAPGCSNLPVALSALPDEPWRTAQCAPHPPPAVTSSPCIPQSRPGAGVPPRTPASVVRVCTCTMPPLIWRYCKMFFTESAARGLIDVIDVIDHAWRPIDIALLTHAGACGAAPPMRTFAITMVAALETSAAAAANPVIAVATGSSDCE